MSTDDPYKDSPFAPRPETPQPDANVASAPPVIPPIPPSPSAAEPAAVPDPEPAASPKLAPAPRDTKRRNLIFAGVAGALVVAGIITAIVVVSNQPTALEATATVCAGRGALDILTAAGEENADASDADLEEVVDKYGAGLISVEDGGKTLIVATMPQDNDPAGISAIWLRCVEDQLEMPTRVTENISGTRALDGNQSDDWDGYNAQWRYHPDNGLNLIISMK